MTMPVRWSPLALLLLLFLVSLLAFSRITSTSTRPDLDLDFTDTLASTASKSKRNIALSFAPLLQEEQHLRSRNAQILQDLEETDFQLELDCASPPSSPLDLTSQGLSREERSLQKADFELQLNFEIQRLIQKHQYDSTILNESPSALHRHLERKLKHQKRLQSAYRASLHQQAALSYASLECVAWRKKQQWQQQRGPSFSQSSAVASAATTQDSIDGNSFVGTNAAMTMAAALTRFQQFHPNRRDLAPNSVFAQTLNALAQKQYTDANGFVVELDPIKLMAGSRRASTYLNDDIHVLVLDMQWDPEVTVVVGNVLDETVRLRQEGYRPVMLNVGNNLVPGGDYHLDAATDNEADLFRRTTLHQCLDQEPRRTRFYPLPENGGVYCPNQAVFRHSLDRGNAFMDRFEWISVVSVAPISTLETREKEGGLGGVQFLEGEDDLLRRKILAAMKVGVSQGHDALVLPPHGTETGQNPAEAIAAIYRSIIGRDFMGGRKRFQTYKKIVMVLDPEQADRVVNETSSYRPLLALNTTTTLLPEQQEVVEPQDGDDESQDGAQESRDRHVDLVEKSILEKRFDQEEEDEVEVEEVKQNSIDPESNTTAEDRGYESDHGLLEQPLQDRVLTEDRVGDDSSDNHNDNDNDNENDDNEEADNEELLEEQGDNPSSLDEQPADDEVFVDEEADNGDELLLDHLAPEDEMLESEALLEEQDLEENADLSDEALEEDLKDVLQIVEADATADDLDSEIEGKKETNVEAASDEETQPESDEDNNVQGSLVEKKEEEIVIPITETVREVFERMLEQRSLLIVKNRARGLLDPEELENSKASSNETTSADTPQPTTADIFVLSNVPVTSTA